MKSHLFAVLLSLSSILLSNSTSATIPSSVGWYFTTIQYTTVNGLQQQIYSDMGPYSSEYQCHQAYDAHFSNSNSIPYAGSPGCFELYPNEVELYQEMLDVWNSPLIGNTKPDVRHNINEVLASISILIEQHRIKEYREAVIQLSTQKR